MDARTCKDCLYYYGATNESFFCTRLSKKISLDYEACKLYLDYLLLVNNDRAVNIIESLDLERD